MRLGFVFALIFLFISLFGQTNEVLLPAKEKNVWGFIDKHGSWKISPQYDQCHPFKNREYTWVLQDGKSFLINKKGQQITELSVTDISFIYGDMLVFKQDGLYGMQSKNSRLRISPTFRSIEYINSPEESFVVSTGLKSGVLNAKGVYLIDTAYDHVIEQDGFFYCYKADSVGLYNHMGTELAPCIYANIEKRGSHFITTHHDGSKQIKNENGEAIFNGRFDDVDPLVSGYFELKQNEKAYLLNAPERLIVDSLALAYDRFNRKYITIRTSTGLGVYSTQLNRIIIDPVYEQVYSLQNSSYLMPYNDYKYGLIDSTGTTVVDNKYHQIGMFVNGLSTVEYQGKFGLLAEEGREVLPCKFSFLAKGSDGVIKAKKDSMIYLFDLNSRNEIIDSMIFTNTATMKLGGRIQMDVVNGNVRQQTTSQFWFQDKKGKWGLKYPNGEVSIKPIYDAVYKVPNTPMVIGKIFIPKTVTHRTGLSLRSRAVYGIVNEEKFKPVIQAGLVYVDTTGIRDSAVHVMRVMYSNGYMATVNRFSGRILRYTSKYIGPFTNGYAKIFVGTKFYKTAKPILCDLGSAISFANEFNMSYPNYRSRWQTRIDGLGFWAYIDRDGRYIMDLKEFKKLDIRACENFRNERAIIMNRDSLFGLMDGNGNLRLKDVYLEIAFLPGTNDSLLMTRVRKNRYGYVREDGTTIADVQYTKALPFTDNQTWCFNDHLTVLLKNNGDFTSYEGLHKVSNFYNGVAGFAEERRMAFVDSMGNVHSDFLFTKIGQHAEELIPAKVRGKYGYFTLEGQVIIKPVYNKAGPFVNGVALVRHKESKRKNAMYRYINLQNEFVNRNKYSKAESINENGYAEVRNGSKRGVVNAKGIEIIKPKYQKIYYGDGRFACYYRGTTVVYDNEGNKIKKYRASSIRSGYSDGLLVIKRFKKYGAVDLEGKTAMKYKYAKLMPFENGLTVSQKGINYTILNSEGDTVKTEYGRVRGGFSEGLLLVRKGKSYQYINTSGNQVFGSLYSDAKPFENGTAVVAIDGKYGLIDRTGFYRIFPSYSYVDRPQNGVSIVGLSSAVGVCDLNTNYLVAPECTYINYLPNEGVFQFQFKNQFGYFTKSGDLVWDID